MHTTRRQFMQLLGTGAVASAGLTQTATAQSTPVVEMGNNYFDPVGLHVEAGTTVRFELAAGVHSATAYEERIPADAVPFNSGVISEGAFEHTFETPGTYDYYCIPHESVGMVGRIVVGDPGGPAEQTPIPYGSVPDSETIVQENAISDGESGDGATGGGGMMGGQGMGPGMMGGRYTGGFSGIPLLGGLLGVLGVAGAAAYLAADRRTDSPMTTDPSLAALRSQYARGEIDEETFRNRRERLSNEESRD